MSVAPISAPLHPPPLASQPSPLAQLYKKKQLEAQRLMQQQQAAAAAPSHVARRRNPGALEQFVEELDWK
jgi:hypothetical protein